jgi:hypothetical protein
MNICKTCRHWDTGPCIAKGYGSCRFIGDAYEDATPPPIAYAEAGASDGNWRASLYTLSTFGCNQWTEKGT